MQPTANANTRLEQTGSDGNKKNDTSNLALSFNYHIGRITADGADATNVELVHHKFETMGAEAGASMRKDVDGGWPGMLEHFKREAEASSRPTQAAGRAARI